MSDTRVMMRSPVGDLGDAALMGEMAPFGVLTVELLMIPALRVFGETPSAGNPHVALSPMRTAGELGVAGTVFVMGLPIFGETATKARFVTGEPASAASALVESVVLVVPVVVVVVVVVVVDEVAAASCVVAASRLPVLLRLRSSVCCRVSRRFSPVSSTMNTPDVSAR
jgi:hypothetical protein